MIPLQKENILSTGHAHGFEWAVLHNGMGYRCGYIKIPKGHPWHCIDHNDINANVHGGLTFADNDDEDGGWWIGFDCAHYNDLRDCDLPCKLDMVAETIMGFASLFENPSGSGSGVRSQEYVEQQCIKLCEQAKDNESK